MTGYAPGLYVVLLSVALAAPLAAQDPAPTRRMVVTFDDLPANAVTLDTGTQRAVMDGLMDALRRAGVRATGFVNESKLYENGMVIPERRALLEAWIDAGHELGNHTFSHPDLHTTALELYRQDIRHGESVTRELLHARDAAPLWFRHPMLHTGRSLETRAAVEATLDSMGYRVAPVTIDNQEWIFARAYEHALLREDGELARRILDAYLDYMDGIVRYYEAQSVALFGYELPQVLLLHANRLAVASIETLIDGWRARGYAFVDLDSALTDPAYDSPDDYTGPGGITWLHRWALTQGRRGEFFAGEPEVPPFVRAAFDRGPPT